jgi:DNA primase large subunit
MTLEDLRFCAKYPFTKEARDYLDFLKINLDNLDDSMIEYGAKRITESLGDFSKYAREKFEQIRTSKEPYLMNELISYPVSKILTALTEDRSLKKKFAKAEAQKVYYFLQLENEDSLYDIAKQFFHVQREKGVFLVPFQEYLNNMPEEKEYALVNLEIENGRIRLDKEKLAKLVSQYLYQSIVTAKIDKRDIKNKMFLYFVDEIKKDRRYAVPEDLGKVEFEAFPPCMRKIYHELQSEEKVSHMPRFVFSTFLASIKMPIEEAISLFKNQSNFNEKKTRYYLEHSYGLKSSKVKYSVPTCSKMDSYGVCYRDQTCKWNHPMTYYAKTKKARK